MNYPLSISPTDGGSVAVALYMSIHWRKCINKQHID